MFPENKQGLPAIYNKAINELAHEPCLFIFAHDDIHITDFHWMQAILSGLSHFGIVGVAGNTRRVPFQPSWAFIDLNFTWDTPQFLSGVVGHGKGFPPASLNYFGPPFQEVKLLDGLILGVFSETLMKTGLRFDEQFQFDFYDMDFCRQAESLGITMGTVPLSLIHESDGGFDSEAWRASYKLYLQKWKQ